jgi:N-acetylmuramoyl-L-alanine amidase
MNPRLAVIVGHSKKHPGSRGVFPLAVMEYDFNHEIAMSIYLEAKQIGLDCRVFTRDGISIEKVGELVSTWCGKDGLAVELHCNSFDGKTAGTETLYDEQPSTNKDFSTLMHQELIKIFGKQRRADRGIRIRSTKDIDASNDRGAINMESVTCTSCLLEPVFWDNEHEAKLLNLKRQEYVRAVVSVCSRWYLKVGEGEK